MKISVLIVLVLLIRAIPTEAQATVILKRSVIGASGGLTYANSHKFHLQSAIAQSSPIKIGTKDRYSLAQGFLQPNGIKAGEPPIRKIIQFEMFPNPSHGQVNLVLSDQPEDVSLLIYNIDGRQMMNEHLGASKTMTIELNKKVLTRGIYHVVLKNKGQILGTEKLLLL
ncbi:MAG: T9SS type A sorting domain-containing protein [Reichenbachiella sp.]|uniref:T9SS type A sorting domain-containing protein n=1 Tax=Reichenbachiella sp. TaxID=2184521 RepID=UPI0032673279